jgi:hypothetical protein
MYFKRAIILFSLLTNYVFAQKNYVGKYLDAFGAEINIYSDSTFIYNWHYDMSSSWTKGKWKVQKKKLQLKTVLVYDSVKNHRNTGKDTLVLSVDEKSDIVVYDKRYLISSIAPFGQNKFRCPTQFIIKGNRLIEIDDRGKLITRKARQLYSGKKCRPWYTKEE